MRICIFGNTGFVGSTLCEHFRLGGHEVFGVNRSTTDIPTDYDLVINAAGNSVKYLANANPQMDFEKNVSIFSKIVGLNTKNMVHISSVDADVKNTSNYSKSKRVSEYCARTYFPEAIILRLGGLVGPNLRKNVIYDITNNRDLYVKFDSRFNFISTREIGAIIEDMLLKRTLGMTVNVAAQDSITVREIIKLYRSLGHDFTGREGTELQDYSEVDIATLRNIRCPKTSKEYVLEYLEKDHI